MIVIDFDYQNKQRKKYKFTNDNRLSIEIKSQSTCFTRVVL